MKLSHADFTQVARTLACVYSAKKAEYDGRVRETTTYLKDALAIWEQRGALGRISEMLNRVERSNSMVRIEALERGLHEQVRNVVERLQVALSEDEE